MADETSGEEKSEPVPASTLSLMLGVGNRRKLTKHARLSIFFKDKNNRSHPRKFTVQKVLLHHDYNPSTLQHDIALLKIGVSFYDNSCK